MKHIMNKIAKEILEQKEKQRTDEQIRLIQEALDEACRNDTSHTRNLSE